MTTDPPQSTVPTAGPEQTPPRTGWRRDFVVGAALSRAWLARPRVRLSLAGVALLAVGAVILSSSVWTLPLVIAGTLMVLTAWIGHRLEGRLALRWGPDGAQLDFRATVKPAHEAARAPAPVAIAPTAEPEVIEGEAHTVEIDVSELRALIAAAQASSPEIRIRRMEEQGAPAPEAAA